MQMTSATRVTPPRYGDRQHVTLRLPRPLHEALIKETRTTGRSLTGEIEAKLTRALLWEEAVIAGTNQQTDEMEQLKKTVVTLTDTIDRLTTQNSKLLDLNTKLTEKLLDGGTFGPGIRRRRWNTMRGGDQHRDQISERGADSLGMLTAQYRGNLPNQNL